MTLSNLDQVLTSIAGRLRASSMCVIQGDCALSFAAFDMLTVHFVLRGAGSVRIGGGAPLPFEQSNILIVPARQPHIVGGAGSASRIVVGDDHCSLVGDGLVRFTAGSGDGDIVLLCGMVAASGHLSDASGLLSAPAVEALPENPTVRFALEQMAAEVANPRLGTHAMAEALMRQCLVVLLRRQLESLGAEIAPAGGTHQSRLLRAAFAVTAGPAHPHSVASLAALAGMSRASFAEHFTRVFRQTPIDFVQTERMQVAARLLRETDLPVKVVSRSIGYTAPAFSRAFRARFGSDPTAYRERETGPG